MQTPLISVISPVYGAENIIDELVKQLVKELSEISTNYEIILIDDCGPDNSWGKIKENCATNERIKGIKLSRNFGQHSAISAGIDQAKGKYLVIMDCDLQDDPKYISKMYSIINNGYDIVYTYKDVRRHSFFKNLTAFFYIKLLNYLIDDKRHKSDMNVGAFSMISRKVANAFKSYNDYHRHYLLVLGWMGFNSFYMKIEHKQRFSGKSSYTISKLLKHALIGITSQSDKLLRVFVSLGLFVSLLSFLTIFLIIALYFVHGFLSGWASLIVAILFSTGLILSGIGVLGIYLGKTFEQTKNRPKYLIDETYN